MLFRSESIRKKTFSEGNIKSAFRKCGFVPFRPALVLRQITVNEAVLTDRIEHRQEEQVDSDLQEIWSSPNTHNKLYQQAGAIQDMLRSSIEPPDTPTRLCNRTNVDTFMQNILAKDLVHKQLTDYMWDSHVAQIQQEHRKNRPRSQIQKGGVVYASDIDWEISNLQELNAKWEADLPTDQKVYLLVLRSMVLLQLLLKTKGLKETADRSAINCQRRATNRANKQRKLEGMDQV